VKGRGGNSEQGIGNLGGGASASRLGGKFERTLGNNIKKLIAKGKWEFFHEFKQKKGGGLTNQRNIG